MNATITIHEQDVAQIQQILADREDAMRARDAERFVSHYAPGIVQFDLAPPLQHTGSEVSEPDGLREWMSGFVGPIKWENHDVTVTVDGDIAFCHGLNRMAATARGPVPGPDGAIYENQPFELWLRATICLQRINGTWRVTHEHMSVPFLMDGSFQAAVDLRP